MDLIKNMRSRTIALVFSFFAIGIIFIYFFLQGPVIPLHVSGRRVVDAFNRPVVMKGFSLDQGKLLGYRNGSYSYEDIKRIKDWGFFFIYNQFWWNRGEPEPHIRDYSDLETISRYIDIADEVGLYWIFRFRVSHDDTVIEPNPWWGWPRAGYVSTEEGLAHYCDFLIDIISKLEERHDNIVAYMPWQFPFHDTPEVSIEQNSFYYDRVIPEMIKAVRSVTNKPIIVAPIHCSLAKVSEIPKYEDNNLIYGAVNYIPVIHGVYTPKEQPIWNGTEIDIQFQWNNMQQAIDLVESLNVPFNIVETGISLDRQDQIDKMRLKLEIFKEYDVGWCYWWYSWYESGKINYNLFWADGTPKQGIVDLLLEFNSWH